MKKISPSLPLLTEKTGRLGAFLTLLSFLTFLPQTLLAANPMIMEQLQYNNATPYKVPPDQAMRDQRLQDLRTYVRQQAPHLMPILADEIRQPLQWAIGNLQNGKSFFNISLSNNAPEGNSVLPPASKPGLAPADSEEAWPTLFGTGYHHRSGILPTHDALLLGGHAKNLLFGRYLQTDLHPYFGQNYFSQNHYYGTDLTVNIGSPEDHASTHRPWGSVSMGFTAGDERLMDHGKGFHLGGTVNFNQQLSLNSGIRQEDSGSSGNYVLLVWKIATN